MRMLVDRIEVIMRIVGWASAAGLLVAIAPAMVLGEMLGWTPADAFSEVVVRSWGSLVGLLGLALVYGARVPGARRLALMLSCAGKACFLILLVAFAPALLWPLAPVVAFDGAAVLLFAGYLLTA